MPTQRRLPLILGPDQSLEDLWERLPASGQREVIALYAQLIARAALVGRSPGDKGATPMTSSAEGQTKIRPEHLDRAAYVYVRQSSPYQVEHHREGRLRQYDLVAWAHEMGWPKERIVGRC